MTERVTFESPPVVETVLAVQFERLKGLTNAHLGAFWESLRAEWPLVNDASRIEDQYELFGEAAVWGRGLKLQLTQDPSERIQMKTASRDRMIQVQNCWFAYNWLKKEGGEYPRYETVKPEFDDNLGKFRSFMSDLDFGDLVPAQWEVTYVNHLPKGTVWESAADCVGVFTGLPSVAAVPEGLALETFGGQWHFEIVPQKGRLHVSIAHARLASPEGPEALEVKLTARGPMVKDMGFDESVTSGLDLGHQTVVSAFRDLTSKESHEYWNRKP